MHPAASIIFFTVASGTGYGTLFWLGLHSLAQPPDPTRGVIVLLVALALVSAGLVSSTFHLGHPERLARLLMAACLAYIWIVYLGALAQRDGWQALIHRPDRCDWSLFQLGLSLITFLVNERPDHPIPVPLRAAS